MSARAESSPLHLPPTPPFSPEPIKQEVLDDRFDVRSHTLIKSYSFLTKDDGWYRFDFPYFEETLRKEIIPYDHNELSEKLHNAQDADFAPDTAGMNHYHTQNALVGLCDFIIPKLAPLQGPHIVPTSAYKEVLFGDDERFSRADVIYLVPDMSIIIVEVGRENGRIQQVKRQIRGLEDLAGQELTIYTFFCRYEFNSNSSAPNNNSGKEKRLTFRPIMLD